MFSFFTLSEANAALPDVIKKFEYSLSKKNEVNKLEQQLQISLSSENTFEKAVNLINKDFSPLDDMRASSEYRLAVAKNLLLKAFYEIKNKQTIRIN